MFNLKNIIFLTFSLVFSSGVLANDAQDGDAAIDRKDYATALIKYKRAAEKNNVGAQFNLGNMYNGGLGVKQDYAEAARWYKLAAAQGDATAQFNLGNKYGKGEGVVQDITRAYMWFNLASALGNQKAEYNSNLAAKYMTQQQVAEAQKLARECQARNFKNCD